MKKLFLFILLLFSVCSLSAQTALAIDLITAGASWKYLDNGSNQGTAWRNIAFNDATWKTGNAELGYGDGGETTVVNYGPSSSGKFITTYFRKKFNVTGVSGISGLELGLVRDDGAVVYLNGVEVYRSNMPAGSISYTTLASAVIDGAAESAYISANISLSALQEGDNIIAVEIHQQNAASSDISFNFKLRTSGGINFTPGLFAVIGDYGMSGPNEAAVANLVKSWSPEYIITTGDNNYPNGASSTIDANIGQYYHQYISPYTGGYGSSADVNRFYPSLGNHDTITAGGAPYFQYFTLPGNERYYDFVKGNIHFFVVNSNPSEPNGVSSASIQGIWLKNKLAASVSKWKIVYFHHSPYTSDQVHGSQTWMQWPFKAWGADVVLSGHSHIYERVRRDSFTYFVNGLGGHSKYSFSSTPVAGSVVRYNANYGAMKVLVKQDTLWFKFYSVSNALIDSYPLIKTSGTAICDAVITPGGATTFCPGGNVTLKANTGTGFSYQWKRNGTDISGATSPAYVASIAGDYQLKVSFQGCTDWSAPLKVTINTSLTAKITPGGPTTFCSGGKVALYANTCNGYIYQWKKNGTNISGATGPVYYANSTGNYQVKIISGSSVAWSAQIAVTVNACVEDDSIPSEGTDSVNTRIAEQEQKFLVNVFPNPTTGLFSFELCLEDAPEEMIGINVINSIGQMIYERQSAQKEGCVKETIELDNRLPAGVYILQIRIGDKVESTKLLLNR